MFIDAIAGPSLFLGGTNLLLIAAVIIFFAVSVVLVVFLVEQYIEVKRKKAKEQSNDVESQNDTF